MASNSSLTGSSPAPSGSALPPDESLGPLALGLLGTAFAICTITIGLRFYVRFTRRTHGWDDYLIYLAWVAALVDQVAVAMSVHYGIGRHSIYVEKNLQSYGPWVPVVQVCQTLGVCLVRASIALLLLRLISRTYRVWQITLWAIMAINFAFTFVALLMGGLDCMPLAKEWVPSMEGYCFPGSMLQNVTKSLGAIGSALDFASVLIAMTIFLRLQTSKRTKLVLVGLSCVAIVTAACSIGKAVAAAYTGTDGTVAGLVVTIWGGLELRLGITAVSLPTIHCLFIDVETFLLGRLQSLRSRNTANLSGSINILRSRGGGHSCRKENKGAQVDEDQIRLAKEQTNSTIEVPEIV